MLLKMLFQILKISVVFPTQVSIYSSTDTVVEFGAGRDFRDRLSFILEMRKLMLQEAV